MNDVDYRKKTEDRFADLERRIAELDERTIGMIRLGPSPQRDEEFEKARDAKIKRILDVLCP